jgi:hypothetical protein
MCVCAGVQNKFTDKNLARLLEKNGRAKEAMGYLDVVAVGT